VAAWRFDPAALSLTVGGSITATNYGGEVHTFTEDAQFGGGIVPALNTASGNQTRLRRPNAKTSPMRIASRRRHVQDRCRDDHWHALYQCCVHPWMRETVSVTNP